MDGVVIVGVVLSTLIPFEVYQLNILFRHERKLTKIEGKICGDD